jgi:hypothetical protein
VVRSKPGSFAERANMKALDSADVDYQRLTTGFLELLCMSGIARCRLWLSFEERDVPNFSSPGRVSFIVIQEARSIHLAGL